MHLFDVAFYIYKLHTTFVFCHLSFCHKIPNIVFMNFCQTRNKEHQGYRIITTSFPKLRQKGLNDVLLIDVFLMIFKYELIKTFSF